MRRVVLALVCVAPLLAGCKDDAPPPPIRPVLSVVVAPQAERTYGFTGTIEPRFKINLGFRVLGRLVSRDVEVGDQVKAGAEIASIDSTALAFAVRSAIADVSSARAQLVNTTGAEGRQRILAGRNVVPQAQLDSAVQAQDTAGATARRAEANLTKASEELTYAKLRSDIDGVVTAVGAQVGQVVAVGKPVVTVARPDVREAAVDVPDDLAGAITPGTAFDVALQLDPKVRLTGQVREISPLADPSTRTRHVMIALPDAGEVFRLGTTITATLRLRTTPTIEVPLGAVLEKDGKSFVWLVDEAAATVAPREVRLGRRTGGVVQVSDGLVEGMRVVTAGVHSLAPGQKVKVAK